jgi:hypothetical protein
MVTGTTDNGGEDSSWCVVTGETGLTHTRTIVDDESSNFFLHCDRLNKELGGRKGKKEKKDGMRLEGEYSWD